MNRVMQQGEKPRYLIESNDPTQYLSFCDIHIRHHP